MTTTSNFWLRRRRRRFLEDFYRLTQEMLRRIDELRETLARDRTG